jgi:hypothetical protein
MFSLRLARLWRILPLHLAYNPNPLELMTEPSTLGAYLRRERERRGLALRTISESTKLSVGLLEGLEADDISRWPGGIFRRAFVRSYAQCVGLDPDDVFKRFEQQHPLPETQVLTPVAHSTVAAIASGPSDQVVPSRATAQEQRARVLGTAADLTVAIVLAFGSAAAGSRLLWPVLLISAYYAIGILLTGTSPMVALLTEVPAPAPKPFDTAQGRPFDKAQGGPQVPAAPATEQLTPPPAAPARPQPRRTSDRPRQRRGAQARA